MTVATTTLGERGLLRLPASIRDQAGLSKGDEMIVVAVGPGRVVLTTRAAIQDEVWAAAPPPGQETSVRGERAADDEAVAAKRRRTRGRTTSEADSDRIGAALLERFGD
jgi:bifunctional DNA-binding transcriptional regulator/antitoxin component of YhaV-PrlF toxin-antitoxin module